MGRMLVTLLVAFASLHAATPQSSLSERRATLQPEIFLTTLTPDELAKRPASDPLEHDTEVSRGEALTIVVTIAACEPGANGECDASADVATLQPDGKVHSEIKNLSLKTRRTTAPLTFDAKAPAGLYRIVATVRDLNARRFGKAERIFGLKDTTMAQPRAN